MCLCLFGALCCLCKVLILLAVTTLLAIFTLAHLWHVSLFVALCTGHFLPFDLADVLFVRTCAPVACYRVVAPATCVARHLGLLDPLLLLGQHPACCVHSCLPLVDLILHLLHQCCVKFDQLLFEGVLCACCERQCDEQFLRGEFVDVCNICGLQECVDVK